MVTLAGARRVRLDEKITVMAADCEFTSMVPRSAPGRKYTAAVGLGSTPGSDLGMFRATRTPGRVRRGTGTVDR